MRKVKQTSKSLAVAAKKRKKISLRNLRSNFPQQTVRHFQT